MNGVAGLQFESRELSGVRGMLGDVEGHVEGGLYSNGVFPGMGGASVNEMFTSCLDLQ